jgi:4-amino-4-deoxychorismate lyase
VFETLAVRAGQPLLLERHMARLSEGCKRLGIVIDRSLLRSELVDYAARLGEGVLKLIVTRGDSQRGYAADPSTPPRRILQGSALPSYPRANAEHGVHLFSCATRLAEQPALAGMKHLNRLEQVLARNEWSDPRYAEGLMLDVSGRVIEGVYSNLFLVRDGVLLTPDLQRCGVAGVMRAELLAQAAALGIANQVLELWPADLAQADEVFMCNSVYGIWPVLACGSLNWSAGPLTRKLQGIARMLLDA